MVITRSTPTVVIMSAMTLAVIATRAERGRRSLRAYPRYGIAAVILPAEARFSASTITRISMRLSLVGAQVDCRMKTSRPRTFSSNSTITSPSEKRPTIHRPRLMFMCLTTASASLGLALPVKTRMRSNAIAPPKVNRQRRAGQGTHVARPARHGFGWGGRDRTYECRNQNPVPYHLATPQGKLSHPKFLKADIAQANDQSG